MNDILEQSDVEKKITELNNKFDRLKKEQLSVIKEQIRRRGLVDLIFLSEEILGAWNLGKIHKEWALVIDKFWKDKNSDLLLFLVSRGFLKSSLITANWIIQRILENPNIRVLIANEKEDNAKKFLGIIRNQFENNKMLHYVYGDFTSKISKWTEHEFTVGNRTKTLKEPTVMIGSIDKSPVSLHVDLIIEDDLQSRINTQTKAQIDKVHQYHRDLLSLLEPGGKRCVVATRWDFDDVYSRIIRSFDENDIINGEPATEEFKKKFI